MQIPFFNALTDSQNILLAGGGGGFDIATGIPLYLYFRKLGKQVTLANLSFTELELTDCMEVCPGTFQVTAESQNIPYFPEKWIIDWLAMQGETPAMYGFSQELGVKPLSHAYTSLAKRHNIDTLILVDGGTDSLMFGDESGVATIVEDACSIIAASIANIPKSYLVATGFGVEQHHNLDHYACLENIATLTQEDAYLGAFSLTKDMPEGIKYIELVNYLNQCNSNHMSIVNNSIANALQGRFGDYHNNPRTQGSIQFINPLMGLYWCFSLQGIVTHNQFINYVKNSETMHDVAKGYRLYRAANTRRPLGMIPL